MEVLSKNVELASAHTLYAPQLLLRTLSLRKSYFCALLVCAKATFALSEDAQKLLLRTLRMRKSYFCSLLV